MGPPKLEALFALAVVLSVPATSRADVSEEDRGVAGESCRARADCKHGLKCLANVCVDEHEGESCAAHVDCGSLKCIDNKCVNPNARPRVEQPQPQQQQQPQPQQQQQPQPTAKVQEPAPTPPVESHAFEEWLKFRPDGVHPFIGITLAPGLLNGGYTASEGTLWAGGADGAFLLAFRGGVFINRHELALEIAPFTDFWDMRVSGPAFEANVTYAYYVRLLTRETFGLSWPLRGGISVLAGGSNTNDNVFFEVRADVIGLALNVGHLIVEAHLPTFRYEVTNGHVAGIAVEGVTTNYLSFFFGLSASYVF